ncbi:MAG: molybdopterin dinucleotide binding domain-containing protein, partial [Candidatus Diapherotrites archaeon]|nr:molybdopterin dinucleotide binding domain-containing protein [Candidatus Diapherotrites archaeon]
MNGKNHNGYIQKMKVKCLDITTGKPVVLINEIDAKELGIHTLDRVEIFNKRTDKKIVAIVDITDSIVEENELGLYLDVCSKIECAKKDSVFVKAVPKPESMSFIKKK